MRLQSIRYGFATNSSSSHSLVIGAEERWSPATLLSKYKGESGAIQFGSATHRDLSSVVNALLLLLLTGNRVFQETVLQPSMVKRGSFKGLSHDVYEAQVKKLDASDDFKEILLLATGELFQQGGFEEAENSTTYHTEGLTYGSPAYKAFSEARDKVTGTRASMEEVEHFFWLAAPKLVEVGFSYG